MSDHEALAQEYAPVVFLHRDEVFPPMSPDDFIEESRLVWRTQSGIASEQQPVDPSRLGHSSNDPYRSPDGIHSAKDFTRPFDRSRPTDELPLESGFGLWHRDQTPGRLNGDLDSWIASASMLYEVVRVGDATYLCYWLFFGSSTFPLGFDPRERWSEPDLSIRADEDDLLRILSKKVAHQGDWEGITIRIADAPLAVHFRAHGTDTPPVPFDTVQRENKRTIVYCAKGSHASYASPADAGVHDDIVSPDVRWDPLASGRDLQSATGRPWYGFGGSWGDPDLDDGVFRNVPIDWLQRIRRSDLVGPLGPSRHKEVWPGVRPTT